eukprot:CAMPEP_0206140160 /NCGR_PEP_ID=MMETSP1473-20131121/8634_1 /ASSEMBLY_ACC=CAM_ASM_001109 /TAXON_ID=1461547 /ORGANISM="Stichococcus sp, Strain RCC1054" /LENGTH=75 /DNA_ID=CAMNT_0053534221 /DNA_START=527 /DNA_END=754 /DNA_ORIENTATION=+
MDGLHRQQHFREDLSLCHHAQANKSVTAAAPAAAAKAPVLKTVTQASRIAGPLLQQRRSSAGREKYAEADKLKVV